MHETPVFTLSFAPGLRTNGDMVSGILELNVRVAYKTEVEAVKVSLRGEVHTQVTEYSAGSNAAGCLAVHEAERFLNQTKIVWISGAPLPSGASQTASFPLNFTLPPDGLPPSFAGGDGNTRGLVQYYVHATAERKPWYKKKFSTDVAFPFLPVDRGPAPYLVLPDWAGEWQSYEGSKKIRKGIVSRYGHVQVNFSMPKLPEIPLFRPIPVKVHIICSSKALPRSSANDPSKFEFPRNPKLEDCDLNLLQACIVKAQDFCRRISDDLGAPGGFGKDDKKKRATWGHQQVQAETRAPYWVPETGGGRWREEVTFSTVVVFRCPPPFKTSTLSNTLYLEFAVDFPGFGNQLKLSTGALKLSSGIVPRDADRNTSDWDSLPTQATMPGEHYCPPGEMDLPPSYWEVIHSDERENIEYGR